MIFFSTVARLSRSSIETRGNRGAGTNAIDAIDYALQSKRWEDLDGREPGRKREKISESYKNIIIIKKGKLGRAEEKESRAKKKEKKKCGARERPWNGK